MAGGDGLRAVRRICRDQVSKGCGRFAGARTVVILGYSLSGLLLFAAAKLKSPAAAIAALCRALERSTSLNLPFGQLQSIFQKNLPARFLQS